MPGTFPCHQLQRKPLVSDPGMHHGTCVTHACRGREPAMAGETFPAFPAPAQPEILRIWQERYGTIFYFRRPKWVSGWLSLTPFFRTADIVVHEFHIRRKVWLSHLLIRECVSNSVCAFLCVVLFDNSRFYRYPSRLLIGTVDIVNCICASDAQSDDDCNSISRISLDWI